MRVIMYAKVYNSSSTKKLQKTHLMYTSTVSRLNAINQPFKVRYIIAQLKNLIRQFSSTRRCRRAGAGTNSARRSANSTRSGSVNTANTTCGPINRYNTGRIDHRISGIQKFVPQ